MALSENGKRLNTIRDVLFDRHKYIMQKIDELQSVNDFPEVDEWCVVDDYTETLMYRIIVECIVKIISNQEEYSFSSMRRDIMERVDRELDEVVSKAVGKYGKLHMDDRH